MYKNLKNFFENVEDGGEQANFLKQFGREDVQGGICLNLVLAWLYFYKKAEMLKAPNIVWREMKNPTVIKQIANNQSAYINKDNDLHVNDILACYGLNDVNEETFVSPYDVVVVANDTYGKSRMYLWILNFVKNGQITSAHAIGIIKHDNGTIYVYDPNLGVLSIDMANIVELFHAIIYQYEAVWNMRIGTNTVFGIQ